MAHRDPVLIVIRPTRVRVAHGRVITLMPGYKGDAASDRIKSMLSREQLDQVKKGGSVVEETPPWSE